MCSLFCRSRNTRSRLMSTGVIVALRRQFPACNCPKPCARRIQGHPVLPTIIHTNYNADALIRYRFIEEGRERVPLIYLSCWEIKYFILSSHSRPHKDRYGSLLHAWEYEHICRRICGLFQYHKYFPLDSVHCAEPISLFVLHHAALLSILVVQWCVTKKHAICVAIAVR